MAAMTLCLACRRLVGPNRCACDAIELDLVDPVQRQVLVDHVWGDSDTRAARFTGDRRQRRPRVAGAVLGATVAMRLEVGVTGGGVGTLAAGVVGGMVGGVLGTIASFANRVRRGRSSTAILHPVGATPCPAMAASATGRITSAGNVEAAASGAGCAAWAIELRYQGAWGVRTMLRLGGSAGFDVTLAGGARARIPAGPLWLAGELPVLAPLARPALEQLLRTVDPSRDVAIEVWPALPYNLVAEATLNLGDRVELACVLEPLLVAGPHGGNYRDAPETVLTPRGAVIVRLVE